MFYRGLAQYREKLADYVEDMIEDGFFNEEEGWTYYEEEIKRWKEEYDEYEIGLKGEL